MFKHLIHVIAYYKDIKCDLLRQISVSLMIIQVTKLKLSFFCITHYNQDAKHDHLLNE